MPFKFTTNILSGSGENIDFISFAIFTAVILDSLVG